MTEIQSYKTETKKMSKKVSESILHGRIAMKRTCNNVSRSDEKNTILNMLVWFLREFKIEAIRFHWLIFIYVSWRIQWQVWDVSDNFRHKHDLYLNKTIKKSWNIPKITPTNHSNRIVTTGVHQFRGIVRGLFKGLLYSFQWQKSFHISKFP